MSVVAGVLVAVAFALVVPLEWWSLGLLILVSITIGQVLRLRANLIEVAISGMLVLGVGSLNAESAAWQRIAETLVGAAVGGGEPAVSAEGRHRGRRPGHLRAGRVGR